MHDYLSPAALPPHVLEREDMRAALARHDFGTVFTLARKWGGISFTKIAGACGMKTDRVGAVAKGRGRITTIDKIIAIVDGLRIPGAMVGLAPREWEKQQAVGHALGTLPPLPIRELSGEAYAQAIRETSQRLIALDNEFGAASAAEVAAQAFTCVHRRLGESADDPRYERDITAAAAELGEVAAWSLFDAEKQQAARRFNHEALLLARLSGDRAIELLILQNMAMQAGWVGRPREELAIATAVLDDGRLSPRVEAIFRIREAKGLAGIGREREAAHSFARARMLLQDGASGRDPGWAWWVTTDEIDGHEGWVHSNAGNHARAVSCLQRAVLQEAGAKVGYRGISGVRLLTAFLDLKAWSDAEAVAVSLVPTVRETASARTLNLLRSAAKRAPRLPAVKASLRDTLEALDKAIDEDRYAFLNG